MHCHMAEEMCGASAHKQDIKDQYKHFEKLHFKLKCITLCLSEMRGSILIYVCVLNEHLKVNFSRFHRAALSLKLPLTSQYQKCEHFWSTPYRAP